MRGPASVILLSVWLLDSCDTVKRANDAEEAAANCEVLAALSEELCEPDDPTTARVFCAWTPKRIPIGHQPPSPITKRSQGGPFGPAMRPLMSL